MIELQMEECRMNVYGGEKNTKRTTRGHRNPEEIETKQGGHKQNHGIVCLL